MCYFCGAKDFGLQKQCDLIKQQLPNAITLINLFCGCAALVAVLYGYFINAFWFLFVGGIADYLDGMVARWLKVHSSLGKELDSIADMVTFGVVPGAILYMLLNAGFHYADVMETGKVVPPAKAVLDPDFSIKALPGFLVSIFAGLRLAKFNLDTRQTEDFIGLPTPSMTLFMVGLMLIFEYNSFGLRSVVVNPAFLVPVILLFSYLMVSELRMFSFKFKSFRWEGNEIRFIFAGIAILLLVLLRGAAFSAIVLIYLLLAVLQQVFKKI